MCSATYSETPLVSVVIPVYNSAEYIDECLQSLLNQTLTSFEVICVDDGSTDDSPTILDSASASDARVRVFHYQNAGAAEARNRGMAQARGQYLCFVDADDFVEKDYLDAVVSCAEKNDLDIVLFDLDKFIETTGEYVSPNAIVPGSIPDEVVFSPVEIDNLYRNMIGYTVNKLYRKSFLDGLQLRFEHLRAHEDMPFTYVAFSAAKRICFLNRVFYHYRKHDGGSVTDNSFTSYEPMLEALEVFKQQLESHGLYASFEKCFENYALYMFKWKYNTTSGVIRARYIDSLREEWIDRLSVGSQDRSVYLSEDNYSFLQLCREHPYVEQLEIQNKRLSEQLAAARSKNNMMQEQLDRASRPLWRRVGSKVKHLLFG